MVLRFLALLATSIITACSSNISESDTGNLAVFQANARFGDFACGDWKETNRYDSERGGLRVQNIEGQVKCKKVTESQNSNVMVTLAIVEKGKIHEADVRFNGRGKIARFEPGKLPDAEKVKRDKVGTLKERLADLERSVFARGLDAGDVTRALNKLERFTSKSYTNRFVDGALEKSSFKDYRLLMAVRNRIGKDRFLAYAAVYFDKAIAADDELFITNFLLNLNNRRYQIPVSQNKVNVIIQNPAASLDLKAALRKMFRKNATPMEVRIHPGMVGKHTFTVLGSMLRSGDSIQFAKGTYRLGTYGITSRDDRRGSLVKVSCESDNETVLQFQNEKNSRSTFLKHTQIKGCQLEALQGLYVNNAIIENNSITAPYVVVNQNSRISGNVISHNGVDNRRKKQRVGFIKLDIGRRKSTVEFSGNRIDYPPSMVGYANSPFVVDDGRIKLNFLKPRNSGPDLSDREVAALGQLKANNVLNPR